MDTQIIRRILADAGWAKAEPLVLRHAREAYELTAAPAPDGLGATRLGGMPDLPPGIAWPTDRDGRPGNFLGQLDLADLAARAPLDGFPPSGLISLFMTEFLGAGDPVGMAAVFTPAGTPLVRHARLDDPAGYADPDHGPFTPIGVDAHRRLSLPLTSPVWAREAGAVLAADEIEQLGELFESGRDRFVGQLGGYGTPFDSGDQRRMLYFHRIGRGGLQYADSFTDRAHVDDWLARTRAEGGVLAERAEQRLPDIEWILEHDAEIQTEAERLRLLIRIDSNQEMGLLLNDADPIYVYVPADDLARGDVSRVEALVTQG